MTTYGAGAADVKEEVSGFDVPSGFTRLHQNGLTGHPQLQTWARVGSFSLFFAGVNGLRNRCSATELRRHHICQCSLRVLSGRRPSGLSCITARSGYRP